MPDVDFKPQKYKGPSYEDTLKVRKERLSPALFHFHQQPVLIHQGHKQWVWDSNGKRYLDMIAGIVTVGVGHCHPKLNDAAFEQMKKVWHTTTVFLNPTVQEYAEKLGSKLPGNLKVCYFTNSGGEANDLAIMMARLYTGCYDIVGLRSCYHGMSALLMGLTALGNWRFNLPINSGLHHAMNPDPYRGPWGGKNCRDSPVQVDRQCSCKPNECKAKDEYIKQLEDLVITTLPKNRVAGFIAESIQGAGGATQFPKGYLKEAYKMIRARGGVCIADEVQTGFGRTGEHFWGFEMHDVVPDIVVMAKSIANGFPMGAVVTTPEIAQVMTQAQHFNTYGGNPIACTAASTVLDIIDEEKLQANSLTVGTHLLRRLGQLREEFSVVGDVRGKGLMIGVELVADKETKTPLAAEDVAGIWDNVRDLGVLIGKGGLHGNVLRVKPPMCITKEDADFFVDVLRVALTKHKGNK